MILKNKRTRETLQIEYSEFRKKFAKEIETAFESYRKTQLNKYSWNFKDDNSLEINYYFKIQWNFNHFRMSKRNKKKLWFRLINIFTQYYSKLIIKAL